MNARSMLLLLASLALTTAACGASQAQEERGEVFCESYENTFTGQCRQNCETTGDDDNNQT